MYVIHVCYVNLMIYVTCYALVLVYVTLATRRAETLASGKYYSFPIDDIAPTKLQISPFAVHLQPIEVLGISCVEIHVYSCALFLSGARETYTKQVCSWAVCSTHAATLVEHTAP